MAWFGGADLKPIEEFIVMFMGILRGSERSKTREVAKHTLDMLDSNRRSMESGARTTCRRA